MSIELQHKLFKRYMKCESNVLFFITFNENKSECTNIIYKMENGELNAYWSNVIDMARGKKENEKKVSHKSVENIFGIELKTIRDGYFEAKIRALGDLIFFIDGVQRKTTLNDKKVLCIEMEGLDIYNACVKSISVNCIEPYCAIPVEITFEIENILKNVHEKMPHAKWMKYFM